MPDFDPREAPDFAHETDNYSEKVCMWAAISSHGTTGPFFFFKNTVNSVRYMDTLQNRFLPQLLATRFPLKTQWFMQNGASPQTSICCSGYPAWTIWVPRDVPSIYRTFPRRFNEATTQP